MFSISKKWYKYTYQTNLSIPCQQKIYEMRINLFVHAMCQMPNWVVPYRMWRINHLKYDVMMVSFRKHRLYRVCRACHVAFWLLRDCVSSSGLKTASALWKAYKSKQQSSISFFDLVLSEMESEELDSKLVL